MNIFFILIFILGNGDSFFISSNEDIKLKTSSYIASLTRILDRIVSPVLFLTKRKRKKKRSNICNNNQPHKKNMLLYTTEKLFDSSIVEIKRRISKSCRRFNSQIIDLSGNERIWSCSIEDHRTFKLQKEKIDMGTRARKK